MSCAYYWYNDHYACRKLGKDVDEDTYYRYCRDYNYEECPVYKETGPSRCFLTSACVEAKSLPDDCEELSTLRAFRDGYLRSQPSGADEIAEYYHIAPSIVAAIKEAPDSKEVFGEIYESLVVACVQYIKRGQNEEAHKLYRQTVMALKAKYCEC